MKVFIQNKNIVVKKNWFHRVCRRVLKYLLDPISRVWLWWYKKKSRIFIFKKIKIHVHPEVFPPIFTISTKILLNFIENLPIRDKTFLELGCGSGIISLFASSKGANVTSTDINLIALDELEKNSKNNNLNLDIKYSDLFENISEKHFDYIFINPPYYPKNPSSISENAWFCGQNFEYFTKLFHQLSDYLETFESEVYMILSENCNISKILELSASQNLKLSLFHTKMAFFENNYIYKIDQL